MSYEDCQQAVLGVCHGPLLWWWACWVPFVHSPGLHYACIHTCMHVCVYVLPKRITRDLPGGCFEDC
jgi:hypothetical protein